MSAVKIVGIVLIAAGILGLVYSGFSYTMPQTPHVERHFTGSATVRDIIICPSPPAPQPWLSPALPFLRAPAPRGSAQHRSVRPREQRTSPRAPPNGYRQTVNIRHQRRLTSHNNPTKGQKQ